MNTYAESRSLIVGTCVANRRACHMPTEPGALFTDREIDALAGDVVTRGKNKGTWRARPVKFGTDAYVAHQARIMALALYRMPSECVRLFNDDQQALFWSLTHKLGWLKDQPRERRVQEADQIRIAAGLPTTIPNQH